MAEAETTEAAPVPRPWGYWATFGWALLAVIASMLISIAILEMLRPFFHAAVDLSRVRNLPHEGGTVVLLLVILAASVQIMTLVIAAEAARWPAGKYLGLIRPRGRDLAVGITGFLVLEIASMGLVYLLGIHSETTHLIDIYKSAHAEGTLALLWLVVVVIAPLSEEIVFRGFLHRGWVRSRNGGVIAVIVISLLWSAMHFEYSWFRISNIFAHGLWYGFMRWTSGSTTLAILLHGLNNFIAMVWTTIALESFS